MVVGVIVERAVGVGDLLRVDGQEPDVGIRAGGQVRAVHHGLQVVGDVRSVLEVGTVDLALVLRADAGVGEAGETDVFGAFLILGLGLDGRAQDGRIVLEFAIVFRHVERKDDGCLHDNHLAWVSAFPGDGLMGFSLQLAGQDDGFQAAAAFHQDAVGGCSRCRGVSGAVEAVLVELGVAVDERGLVGEFRFTGIEQEGGVLLHTLPGAVDRQEAHVVVTGVVVGAHAQAGEVEEVDTAAVALGDVHGQVDAGDGVQPVFVFVNGVVLVAVAQGGTQLAEGIDVLLGVGLGEGQAQVSAAAVNGRTLGDGRGAVGNVLRAARGGTHGQALGELRHADVLQDARLGVFVAGNRICGEAQRQAHGRGIRAEVQGIQGGHQREGCFARGEAEDVVADGADGQFGGRVAREGIGHLHLDFLKGELCGVGLIQEAVVHQPFTQAVVHLHAARKDQGCTHAQGKEFSHFSKSS